MVPSMRWRLSLGSSASELCSPRGAGGVSDSACLCARFQRAKKRFAVRRRWLSVVQLRVYVRAACSEMAERKRRLFSELQRCGGVQQ